LSKLTAPSGIEPPGVVGVAYVRSAGSELIEPVMQLDPPGGFGAVPR
jgi:hypothetical protein